MHTPCTCIIDLGLFNNITVDDLVIIYPKTTTKFKDQSLLLTNKSSSTDIVINTSTCACSLNVHEMLLSYKASNSVIPYGGKLWRVQTLADLAENRPTANF